ncbi:MAG: hypothetical protein FWF92_03455 [Oscillospiraceae bacterium]|nr:hypothetical protein [Oscillospiraceae bacterium]
MDTKTIDEIIKEEKKQYYKKWRENNPDKVKKHNSDYWRRRVERKIKFETHKKEGEQ